MLFSEIKIFLYFSVICMLASHPMLMLISLIFLSLFLAMIFYFMFQLSLLSLMIILIILGGMLIIFMYMVSLCPNSKMIMNNKMFLISLICIFIMPFSFFYENYNVFHMNKIYLMNFINMLILMMCYLILSLMVISKNLNWINAPIKKFI
uniref:NADH dehydrogenase subunit 6 n=1 Tax=Rhipicentor nuttalli TaxID=72856 RepID=A0A3G2JZW3_9ACAR|nr:NADH dehydrogenase subunit 6 [Rhipicentor nuttalli]AYN50583.1 NADH dehydrogenase subunit 6 [Rhipicentor nuttalli]